jgi:hypothetical protein
MDGYYFPPRQNKVLWEMSEWICKKCSQYYKWLQAPHILSWWTVLKHATSPIYPSTYLSMLPKLALEVMDLVHGSLFFGNSNCQTLSICYPGSIWIEKIKLLGASNLLTDWHCASYLNIEYHYMLTWSLSVDSICPSIVPQKHYMWKYYSLSI